jgi:hypothetical protein
MKPETMTTVHINLVMKVCFFFSKSDSWGSALVTEPFAFGLPLSEAVSLCSLMAWLDLRGRLPLPLWWNLTSRFVLAMLQ